MVKISLVPHNESYALSMSSLSSAPEVREALGLTIDQTTLEGTIDFIGFVKEQERLGKQYSRVILDETDKVVGVITLKDIDISKKNCFMGTWIGHPYWGKGYNALAKKEILSNAFNDLDLHYVFAGAKLSNVRSRKAQEKLPYIRIDVASQFPEEHRRLETQTNSPALLNVIERETFLNWHPDNASSVANISHSAESSRVLE